MSKQSNSPMDGGALAGRGAEDARGLKPLGRVSCRRLERKLRRALKELGRRCGALWEWSQTQSTPPGAVEWLLDNQYLALREGTQAQRALKGSRWLRGVEGGGALLGHCVRGLLGAVPKLEEEGVERYLEGFQSVRPLTERELSLLVSALVLELVERLERLCSREDALRAGQVPAEEPEALFSALRALEGNQWGPLLEKASVVERVLKHDPSGHYPRMDEDTRRRYRQRLCALARKRRLEEHETAQKVLELARAGEGPKGHVGWYLYRQPLGEDRPLPSGLGYAGAVSALSLGAALWVWWAAGTPAAALLLVLPLSDFIKNVLDFALVRLVPPRAVPRMELEEGIPSKGRTLCVVVSLLTGEESGQELARTLEHYRLANRDAGEELRLGILADLPDSSAPMGAKGLRWVECARRAVEELNGKYGGGFYLFFRRPSFSSRDERYMGWERKRGALTELVCLLRGRDSGLEVLSGEKKWLEKVQFVITLDSDTRLNVGTARQMAGAMLHPLNTPVVDGKRRVVVSGHGLLQPRVAVELEAANRSLFSRAFGGLGGVDPYGSTASDVYHDLFDQGTYTGKGIFQVDAFLTCLDRRFPDNTILSHDLLEGSYLCAGLLGDVELTDGCPYQVYSYFARLHRWVRGDWQLLPWLGRWVRNGRGSWEENPLTPLARWKIFDNLRRSLSPVFTLLALVLGMCLSGRVFAWAGGISVLAAASNLLLSGAEVAVRPGGRRRRYHSTVLAGLSGAIVQTALQLLLLPYQAYVCLTAAATALWRMAVSRKNMLSWVTAAQMEKGKGTVWFYYRRAWFSVAVGVLVLILAQLRLGKAVGLMWLLAPAIAFLISRPARRERPLPAADRAFLLHQATLIWRYFATYLREEDHWLPPDNWREQPGPVLARRTSPTNIGLALLSAMAAVDLDLLPRRRGVELIGHVLTTVEHMEKWRGHLYNWYDTATLRPLQPRYVSTVDSGNLRGCLIALEEGLYEWGEEALAARARVLADAMDCAPLYDPKRRLFSIGYEVEKERLTDGWYDLMASEARQTSFIAVARGEVPQRHWRRLGRMLVGDNDYSGMASWTGTMFEYFMPQLLLPCEPNSLMYETLSFCVYAQKRRGSRTKTPWGISESGFYAFDGALNYQYKAHGVQTLGLKRGLDEELVVAPYASFLALLLAPRSALRNLRRLRDMGLEGRFGLYEAVDYTPGRLPPSAQYEVVRSYMSHHLGMSLLAIDNTLRQGVMQRRFMRDRDMAAYRELLQERMIVGAAVMRREEREIPEKPRPAPGPDLERSGEGFGRLAPQCHLLSGEGYGVLACDNGLTSSHMGDVQITLARPGAYYAPAGVSAFFSGSGGTLGLTPAPLYQTEGEYRWEFQSAQASWYCRREGLSARTTLTVPRRENGELRRVELCWEGSGRLEGELLLYLEPVLCPQRDFEAHPAFSRLFLESALTGEEAVFRRRPRGGAGELFLAAAWSGGEAAAALDRSAALGRGALRSLPHRRPCPLSGEAGSDPCLLVALPVSLGPGERAELTLALAVSDSAEGARAGARRILEGRSGEAASLALLARRLALPQKQALEAFSLLRKLFAVEERKTRLPQSALWPFGVSGDLPIAAGRLAGEEEAERCALWCRWHQLLSRSGYPFDLVILVEEGGDYRRPLASAMREELKKLGAESVLGAKGGIHLLSAQATDAVLDWAKAVLPLEEQAEEEEPIAPPPPVALLPGGAPWHWEEDQIRVEARERLPLLEWGMPLCNECFGWFPNETGAGVLWSGGNAREGKLTPWPNDPLAVGGPERITLTLEGEEWSVFADGDGLPCAVTYRPGLMEWEKELPGGRLFTQAFVPVEGECRVLRFTLSQGHGTLKWRLGDGEALLSPLASGRSVELVTRPGEGRPVCRFVPWEGGRELEDTLAWWAHRASPITFSTPEGALDRYLNGWCLYQVIACRLMARTSQYQNGGAFGFRDQLQDAAALILTWPERTREQLLLAASRQFEEGDVQHWWHPPQGAGVRTRISDDLLWLPFVLSRCCAATGDWSLLEERAPYLSAKPLSPEEKDRYEAPQESGRTDSLYGHALAAIRCVLERGVGEHGLAKMGSGDWNDGMDRVGEKGRGESVWLTWFLALVLQDFAPLCRRMGEEEQARALEERAAQLLKAAEAAWDGAWYRRGYYDDGSPLGSAVSSQCQIDSIAQSFSVLPRGTDWERADRAVSAALERLFDRKNGVVRLLDPPFDGEERPDPGYIRGYPPGVRENGGQYTHAAVWLALACLRLERREEGFQVLRALLPEHHPGQVYRGEPWVLAGDVSSARGREGRAGWTWYTGAAGWYWQVAVGELLGLKLEAGRLTVSPRLPASWPGFRAVWRLSGAILTITVRRTGTASALLDGHPVPGGVELEKLEGDRHLEVTV